MRKFMEESSNTDSLNKPVSEVGADTQERFLNYQAPYALKQILKTLEEKTGIISVYCELDDDVIVVRNDGTAVAVQVSSQQPGRPALKSNSEKFEQSIKNFATLKRRSSFQPVEFLIVSSVGFDSTAKEHLNIRVLIEQCAESVNGKTLPSKTSKFLTKLLVDLESRGLDGFDSSELILLVSKVKLEDGAHLHTINTEVKDELRSIPQIDREGLSQTELAEIFRRIILEISNASSLTLAALKKEISATEINSERRLIEELWIRKKFDRARLTSLIESELKGLKQRRSSNPIPLTSQSLQSKHVLIEIEKRDDQLYLVRRSFSDSLGPTGVQGAPAIGVLLKEVTSSGLEDSSVSGGPDYNPILDQAKELIDKHDPTAARNLLSRYETAIIEDGTSRHKFRFHTNYGAAWESEGNSKEAAHHLFEALTFAPDDVRALCNAAYAAIISDDSDSAEKYSRSAIALEPANPAGYATLIAATRKSGTFEEVLSEVPQSLRSTSEVSYAVGCYAKELEQIDRALEWFEIAAAQEKPHSLKLSMQLGEVLLRVATRSRERAALGALDQTDLVRVERALSIFEDVWSRVGNTDLAKQYDVSLVNISYAARVSHNKAKLGLSLKYLQEYAKSTVLSEQLVKTKALLEVDERDFEAALASLESLESPSDNEIRFLKLELANELQSPAVYRRAFRELIEKDDSAARIEALRIRINHALDRKRLHEASKLLAKLSTEAPTDLLTKVMGAKYNRLIKAPAEANRYLEEAKLLLNANSSLRHRLDYALEVCLGGRPGEAAQALKPIANISQDNLVTQRYVDYLYRAGNIQKVREISENLIAVAKAPVFYRSMLASICEEVNNLNEAKLQYQECIKLSSDEFRLRHEIQLCHLNYRTGNYPEADKFLASKIDSTKLDFLEISLLSHLYVAKGYYFNAIRIVYDLLRRDSRIEAERLYAATFFNTPKHKADWLDVEKVGVDCAVCLTDNLNTKRWFLIEADERELLGESEIHASSVLSQGLLGHRVGDLLNIEHELVSGQVMVEAVVSKYVYAYQKCLPSIAIRMIDTSDPKKLVEELEKDASERREFCLRLEGAYDGCFISFERLAEASGVDFFDAWETFTQIQGRKILCSTGTDEEMGTAQANIKKSSSLVLDFSSLLTLHSFPRSVSDKLLAGKVIYVGQSTLDEIDNHIFVRSGHKAGGYGIFSASDVGNQMFEISKEKIAADCDSLMKLRQWIRSLAKTEGASYLANMRRGKRLGIEKFLGNTAAESVYLAKSKAALLCTNDLFISRYAEGIGKVASVFTEALLLSSFENNQISPEELIQCRVILARNQYYYVHIGHDVLLNAAEEDGWEAGRSLINVSRLLDDPTTPDSAFNVVWAFLLKFFYEARDFNKQMRICEALLDNATRSRDKLEFVKALFATTAELPIQALGRKISIRQLLERWAISRWIIKPWEDMP